MNVEKRAAAGAAGWSLSSATPPPMVATQMPLRVLDQVVDDIRGEPVSSAVAAELVPVEPADALEGAHPDIAARILDDPGYLVVGQPLRHRIAAHRELLGRAIGGQPERGHEQQKQGHGNAGDTERHEMARPSVPEGERYFDNRTGLSYTPSAPNNSSGHTTWSSTR